MSTFYEKIEHATRHDLSRFKTFLIEGQQLGWIRRDLEPFLKATFPNDFLFEEETISLSPSHKNYAERSSAFAHIASSLSAHTGHKLRNEYYAVTTAWGAEPLAQMDRAIVQNFGTSGFGVHVNGYVRKDDGPYLWIGERAANRPVEPGKLDNIIGGGLPIGLTVEENLIKESQEEAGFSADVARTAKAAGILRYKVEHSGGLRNDNLFIYDLELPLSLAPHNTDGEVAAFHLLPLAEVAEIVRTTDRFKFNCNLVIIDFMERHGFLKTSEQDKAQVKQWLTEHKGS